MSKISAKVIADSLCPRGHRATTLVVVMPRIILAEFNTHRMISRNSASSRAIPFEKMVKSIEENPFIPIAFMKDHSGMQGNEFFNEEECKEFKLEWDMCKNAALHYANELSQRGLTKQIVNRLLEPFMWHTVIATATEFENFFALRYDNAAEIHMQELAKCMLEAMNESEPKRLKEGEWHIPFGDDIDEKLIFRTSKSDGLTIHSKPSSAMEGQDSVDNFYLEQRIKIATARCAGVSYTVVGADGKAEDYSKLIKRHDMLVKNFHMSPTEHCCKVMTENEYNFRYGASAGNAIGNGWCGNFKGFIQYRKMIEGENRTDLRLIKKK